MKNHFSRTLRALAAALAAQSLVSVHGVCSTAESAPAQASTLRELEDQEIKIRQDQTITKEERQAQLNAIWKQQLALGNEAPRQKEAVRSVTTNKSAEALQKSAQRTPQKGFSALFPSLFNKKQNQVPDLHVIEKSRALISVVSQKIYIFLDEKHYRTFPVSTSKYGVGDDFGSYKTPTGLFRVKTKLGEGLKPGIVFKSRQPTNEIVRPNAPDRDSIVTRIIWLEGLEKKNRNALERCIYIHGTPEERNLGKPASFGCIRMSSSDIIRAYDLIPENAHVAISDNIDQSTLRKLHYLEVKEIPSGAPVRGSS